MTAREPEPEERATSAPTEPSPPTPASMAEPTIAFRDSTGAPSRRRIGLVAAGAMLLVIVAAATSMAASPAPSGSSDPSTNATPGSNLDLNGPGVFDHGRLGKGMFRTITITAINGNDVTLGTEDGWHRTITVTDSVNLTKGGQDIAVSDLKVGDQVRFRQVRNTDGTFTVTDLAVVVPTIRGTVSGVTSGTFKVTTRDGSVWTITVNGSTTYRVGQSVGSFADVKDGATVVVSGNTTGENAMTALGVKLAPARAVGTVTAKTADSITIKRRDGSNLTIHVDADTTFRVNGTTNAKLSDIPVDMVIGVAGRARSDGSIDADTVVAGTFKGFRGGNGPRFDMPGLFLPGLDTPDVSGGADGPTA